MTKREHATQVHKPDDVGYGLGGCQALNNGYPDTSCPGCQEILRARRVKRERTYGRDSRVVVKPL